MARAAKKIQVVVITGASAGIGRATVRAFAMKGAYIGLLSLNKKRLEAAKKEVETLGGKALIIPTDVADFVQIESAAKMVEDELGPIDIWINNAMVSVFSSIKEITADECKRVTDVTYLGYVYGTLTALKYMLPRDRGIIIQVGSALAYRGIPLQSLYCGAKHAVRGFTESVRTELIHDGSKIKISMLQLPAVNTPQFSWVKSRLPRKPQPVHPIFQPEVAANAILWAASHYRREWYVGASAVRAIIGNKIAPGFIDKYLALKGYEAQQYDGRADPNQPNNLYQSLDGNFEAHGDFDNISHSRSVQLWLTQHRSQFLIIAFIFVILLGWYIFFT